MSLDELDPETQELLRRYGFDAAAFDELQGGVASGELSQASNVVLGLVEPPHESDLARLAEPGTDAWTDLRETGVEAIRAGRVAQAVLAGGMATRFGGVVKGAVEALDGGSFLSWKLGETAALGDALGVEIPVVLMTSFQTDDETRAHVGALRVPEPLWFTQSVSLRLTEGGALFLEAGRPSPYAPGHGDLVSGIRSSGTLDRLRRRGVEHVAVSNVDNLGARLDPVVVGTHIAADRPLTVEVAAKEGDLGGAPARVDGRPGLLEGPQFPSEFDQDRIRVFNTNSATVRLDALDRDFELPWLHVLKQVDGRAAVQLERLYHQISWQLETTFLEVPRSGPYGRFFPIKEPEDLEHARVGLRELLSRNVLD
ncbi:MAG TPA: UTP--glucose-1-phosphate uridylyltransferase [Gaiella sp.]|nr:UTP--glucose-1-phosphate uridylyltransferase [Gaiella sp.]